MAKVQDCPMAKAWKWALGGLPILILVLGNSRM
jgi:hypothetical protein